VSGRPIAAWPAGGDALPRLLAALGTRGHAHAAPETLAEGATVIVTGPADFARARAAGLEPLAAARVLVLSRVGCHPDARAAALRELWEVEETVRRLPHPTLTLRLAPMLGASSPLARRLASRPALGATGRKLVNPVAEGDVVETIARALQGRAVWEGWYEVAGAEPWTLEETAGLCERQLGRAPRDAGAWEPPLEELREHRLCEAEPWLAHFGMTPTPLESDAAWEKAGVPA
jgi:uncharacterized protein YbjT (DUF2867 family)